MNLIHIFFKSSISPFLPLFLSRKTHRQEHQSGWGKFIPQVMGRRNIEETHRTKSYGKKETKIGDKTYNYRMTIEAEIKRTYLQIRKKEINIWNWTQNEEWVPISGTKRKYDQGRQKEVSYNLTTKRGRKTETQIERMKKRVLAESSSMFLSRCAILSQEKDNR